METAIRHMANILSDRITKDIKVRHLDNVRKMLYKAYNDYQEGERDGVDYIFSLDNKEDLLACVKGGLTAREIAYLYNQSQIKTTPFFFFGCNYETPQVIETLKEFDNILCDCVKDIVLNIIAYPYAYESYKGIYERYITDEIINVIYL